MKKQPLKKFSACLLLCMAFIVTTISGVMLFSASANAQIIYTDVNPDFSNTCTSFNSNQPCNKVDSFDLNNDGIFDITLALGASIGPQLTSPPPQSGFVRAYPLNGIAIKTDTLGIPLSMNLNDAIDTNGSWRTTGQLTLIARRQGGIGPFVPGNWPSGTDKYLGLKIVSGGQTNYCWVRLNVAVVLDTLVNNNFPFASFTIKDYAYNSIPNQFILAGQTIATGISPLSFGEGLGVRFFPNPAKDHLTIALGITNKKVEVTIADITGKIIYSTTSSETQKVEVNTNDFAAGIYVVQIQTADFIATKKLVIEK